MDTICGCVPHVDKLSAAGGPPHWHSAVLLVVARIGRIQRSHCRRVARLQFCAEQSKAKHSIRVPRFLGRS